MLDPQAQNDDRRTRSFAKEAAQTEEPVHALGRLNSHAAHEITGPQIFLQSGPSRRLRAKANFRPGGSKAAVTGSVCAGRSLPGSGPSQNSTPGLFCAPRAASATPARKERQRGRRAQVRRTQAPCESGIRDQSTLVRHHALSKQTLENQQRTVERLVGIPGARSLNLGQQVGRPLNRAAIRCRKRLMKSP